MITRASASGMALLAAAVLVAGCGQQNAESGSDAAQLGSAVDARGGGEKSVAETAGSGTEGASDSALGEGGEGPGSAAAGPPPEGFHRDGWGPITSGLSTAGLAALDYPQYQTHEAKEYPNAPGSYFACDVYRVVTPGGDPVYVTARDGLVHGVSSAWLSPSRSDLETAEGLRIGDNLSRIPELYPDAYETSGARSHLYVLDEGDGEGEDADTALTAKVAFDVLEIRSGRADYAMEHEDCWRYPDPTP